MNGRDWVSAMLEAMRRRRSIAAEAFRATLAELPGVLVQVEPLNADAERDGLTRDALQADVETALREAGMAAYTQTVLVAQVPGTPVLHVDVMTIHLDDRYAYSVRLELRQAVTLARARHRGARLDVECAPGGGNGRRREHLGAPGRRALGGDRVRRGVSHGLR